MPEHDDLTVHLLGASPSTGRPLFYAEAPAVETPVAPEAAPTGLVGRVEAALRRFSDGWKHSEGRATRIGRRVWEWLHRRTHPDEPLLARLRSARLVEVLYPVSMTEFEAEAAWSAFLKRGRRRHWPWFVVNAAVAPFCVLLAPLPGPNLLGYWFLYRAVHHALILVGLGRARRHDVPTRFLPRDPHSGPPDPVPLGDFLRRHGVTLPPSTLLCGAG